MKELMQFNPYQVSIEYNPHKGIHNTIEDHYNKDDFLDYEDCLRTGNVYEIRVYPNNAVGFYNICASTCEAAMTAMVKALEGDK